MLLVRFLQAVIVVCLLGIGLVLFQAGAASEGQHIFVADHRQPGAAGALSFDDPTDLKVFQADLQSGKPDYYTFRAAKGTVVKVKLNPLRLPGQDNFRPALALFGPGLPTPLELEKNQLPFSLPAGAGLLLSAPSDSEVSSEVKSGQVAANPADESWTQGAYWERQSLLNELPQDGTYFLAVFNANDQSGKYALAVGDKAQTGLREILTFPVTWTRVHLRFGDLVLPIVAGLIVLGLLLGLVWNYLRLIGRRFGRIRVEQANQTRRRLLQKRLKTRKTQRLNPLLRSPKPLPYRVAPRNEPAAPPVPIIILPTTPEPEPALLTGPRWELLDYPAALPASTANGNGHAHYETNGNGHTNGYHAPAAKLDGLSEWGRQHRPSGKN